MAAVKLRPVKELIGVALFSVVFGTLVFFSFLFRLIVKGPRRILYTKQRNVRPEFLCNDEYGKHEFLMLKNTRVTIHCVINGPRDKPLMLFLHGFPEFWYSWRYQLKEFCKDYRVCAIDMRGYGDSSKPLRVIDYHIDELIEDVQQVIHQLGYKSCLLAGHDWGGAVAWMFAMKYPKMVDKLIACNCPHPGAFQKFLNTSYKQFLKSWYMFFFQVPVLPLMELRSDDLFGISSAFCGKSMGAKKGAFSAEDIEAYKYNLAEYHDLLGPINYYRAMMRYARSDFLQNMRGRKIEAPTLLVWGTNDGALSKEMAELTGDFVENLTLKWVEGASHWVQQEEPGIVNDHIVDFLKKSE